MTLGNFIMVGGTALYLTAWATGLTLIAVGIQGIWMAIEEASK